VKFKNIFSEYNGGIIVIPPEKVKKSFYRCDSHFHLDTLSEMYRDEDIYGMVLIDGKETKIYNVIKRGDYIDFKLQKRYSYDPQKKQKKGGQSAQRIGRIRLEKRDRYIDTVANLVVSTFMSKNNTKININGLAICGLALTKKELYDHEMIQHYFGTIPIKVKTTKNLDPYLSYDETLFEKSYDSSEVLELIKQADDRLVFGKSNIKHALSICTLETIYISSNTSQILREKIDLANVYGCKIVEISSEIAKDYDGMIGVKFFS
tara:strand:- start:134243 stop:135031 length:789 start_codon:yes stop_codon:yes gene_type:complete